MLRPPLVVELVVGLLVGLVLVLGYTHWRGAQDGALAQRYQASQSDLVHTQRLLDSTFVVLRETRDVAALLDLDREAAVTAANLARDSVAALHATLQAHPAPPVTDSVNPAWMHRALALETENGQLQHEVTHLRQGLVDDSAQIDLYARQIVADSVALHAAGQTITTLHGLLDDYKRKADRRFLGLSSGQLATVGAVLGIAGDEYARSHRK